MAHSLKGGISLRNILCVEDSEEERLLLRAGLSGYAVTFAASIKEATPLLEKFSYSLIILDLKLPDGSGIDLLAVARGMEKYSEIPILVLTGSKGLAQKAAAFALGADDYLEKPCDPREVRLRVDAKIRRFEQLYQAREVLRVGELMIDVQGQMLRRTVDQSTISLTSLEFRILYALAKNPGRVYSRDSLIEVAWGGGVAVENRTVDSHIANLRRKVASAGVNVVTVIGSGYKLSEVGDFEARSNL